ncbi:MAG TPA: SAF domain-containing protein [Patescibacteria group bacterium]|nr:SAF domain-containing protein [Patescibacteria group bacterium]
MRRWLVAAAALALGGAVSAGLLAATAPARGTVEVWSATRSVAAGAQLTADAIEPVSLNAQMATFQLFTRGEVNQLLALRATHDLAAGQLIQRSDVTGSSAPLNRRLVFVPIKDVPPAGPGSRVDLLIVGGSPDSPTVQVFALGVEVSSTAPGGLVLVVPSPRAAAFVYAAATLNLAAVVAEPGAAGGSELPVSTADQAIAVASQG